MCLFAQVDGRKPPVPTCKAACTDGRKQEREAPERQSIKSRRGRWTRGCSRHVVAIRVNECNSAHTGFFCPKESHCKH